MTKQWTFALVAIEVRDMLIENMTAVAPGEFATVIGNDSQSVEVPVSVGGYNNIFEANGWNGLCGVALSDTLDALTVMAGPGAIELCRLSAGWPELDDAMPSEVLAALNGWMSLQGKEPVGGTNRQCVEAAFRQFVGDAWTCEAAWVDSGA